MGDRRAHLLDAGLELVAAEGLGGLTHDAVDARGIGPRELGNSLWKKAGVDLTGNWVIKDEARSHSNLLKFAEEKNAYLIIGRLPVVTGKLGNHNLMIMVEKDPMMRRPYIVMEANPEMFPAANVKGAKALSDYLLSDKIQNFLNSFGKEKNEGVPQFRAVKVKLEANTRQDTK